MRSVPRPRGWTWSAVSTVKLTKTAHFSTLSPSARARSIGENHAIPRDERLGSPQPVLHSPQEVPTHPEEILHDAEHRREVLQMGGRLEGTHLTLTLSRRLVEEFGAIVRVLIGMTRRIAAEAARAVDCRRRYSQPGKLRGSERRRTPCAGTSMTYGEPCSNSTPRNTTLRLDEGADFAVTWMLRRPQDAKLGDFVR